MGGCRFGCWELLEAVWGEVLAFGFDPGSDPTCLLAQTSSTACTHPLPPPVEEWFGSA